MVVIELDDEGLVLIIIALLVVIGRFRSRTRTPKTTSKWRGISIHGHSTPFSRRLRRPRLLSKSI